MEPLATAGTLQHLQVPPAAQHGDKRQRRERTARPTDPARVGPYGRDPFGEHRRNRDVLCIAFEKRITLLKIAQVAFPVSHTNVVLKRSALWKTTIVFFYR